VSESSYIFGYDFYHLWSAGKLAGAGRNPYDLALYSGTISQISWPADEGIQVITHPPWTLWLYSLFALLPFELARIAWLSLMSLSFLLCFTYVYRSKLLPLASLAPIHFGFAALVFPPTIYNFFWGQVNFIILIGLLVFLSMHEKQRNFLAGLALSLTFFKPHLLLLVYIYLGIFWLRNKDWKVLVGVVTGLALQCLSVLALNPQIFEFYLAHLSTVTSHDFWGASLGQVLAKSSGIAWLRLLPFAIALPWVSVMASRREYSMERLILIVLPLSLLAAPYIWSHAFILLIFSYFLLVHILFERYGEHSKYIVFAFSLLGALFHASTILEPYWSIFPAAMLILGLSYTTQASTSLG